MQLLLACASKLGTEYSKHQFQVDSVWRKVQTEYPHGLQVAAKMTVEDACAQWTTYESMV